MSLIAGILFLSYVFFKQSVMKLKLCLYMCACFRLDIDQSARRNAQDYFNVQDPDYYEFEGNLEKEFLISFYRL